MRQPRSPKLLRQQENRGEHEERRLCLEFPRALLVEVIVANLVCGGDGTSGVLAIEERSGLLQREAPGLDNEEVAESELEGEPAAVDDVVLPSDVAEGDGVDVLVEDEGD